MPPTQSSRERVKRCLTFQNPDRVPRQLWVLPWASERYPQEIEELCRRFPSDFGGVPTVYKPAARERGEWFKVGEYVDPWGCVFENIQEGVHGEVRNPILQDIARWKQTVQPPHETLDFDRAAAQSAVNRSCAASATFCMAGCCPRPWERFQFLRGAQNALMDVMEAGDDVQGIIRRIHEFHLKELEFWVSTDIDAISFMDDWGSQQQLLIPPAIWRELFKPCYKDYCDLAHAHGKFTFMHSDGYISEIYEDLVEIGVNAVNSQLFCMDMGDLAQRVKGWITFWGEIDRQHILTSPDPEAGRQAVRKVAGHLYNPAGGVIAQFELGPGGNPAVAFAIFDEWDRVGQDVEHG